MSIWLIALALVTAAASATVYRAAAHRETPRSVHAQALLRTPQEKVTGLVGEDWMCSAAEACTMSKVR